MKTVNIYTDGACRGNPGPGGWGVLIEHGDFKKELFGGMQSTTKKMLKIKNYGLN
jgi:ribonuclease HI